MFRLTRGFYQVRQGRVVVTYAPSSGVSVGSSGVSRVLEAESNEAGETSRESCRDRRRACGVAVVLGRVGGFFGMSSLAGFLGLGFAHCWLFSMQRTVSAGTDRLFQPMLFFGMLAAFFLCGLAALATRRNLSVRPGLVVGILAAGVVGTFLLVGGAGFAAGGVMELALAFTVGFSIGGCYLMWGNVYSKLDIRQTALVLFCSIAFGSFLKSLFFYAERGLPSAFVFSLLPVACVASWLFATRHVPERRAHPSGYTSSDTGYLINCLLAVAVFGVALGLVRLVDAGFFSLTPAGSWGCHLLEITVSLLVVSGVYRQRAGLTFPNLWMLILVVYATGLAVSEYANGGFVGGVATGLVTAAQMLEVAFYWFALSDVAQRTGLASDVVFGLGYPVYMLPMAVVSSGAVGGVERLQHMSLLVVYALLVSVYLCMRARPREGQALFTGLVLAATSDGDVLERQMDRAAREFDLSEREREVAELYARGRSRSYISGKLYLSETTVRDHISRVYKKMGVHNKQDFLNKLEK